MTAINVNAVQQVRSADDKSLHGSITTGKEAKHYDSLLVRRRAKAVHSVNLPNFKYQKNQVWRHLKRKIAANVLMRTVTRRSGNPQPSPISTLFKSALVPIFSGEPPEPDCHYCPAGRDSMAIFSSCSVKDEQLCHRQTEHPARREKDIAIHMTSCDVCQPFSQTASI